MAHRKLVWALSLLAAAAPAWAAPEDRPRPATAPPGTAETRYCMWIAPFTGTLIEQVKCWTREQWARQGVDVDKDWPREGVRVEG
ncbi:hypothetical protein GON01_12960 [Sphingomonas sp. MAH-20]|jgi:hypothetical protein|uniref:Uncharacterized protein n=1 Tax=Sphingomonas horti TaxID=2682842 RepID=A0A6I4J2K6_9SPHN|nr:MULTISPECIES: hypothetical protein [Sphingomonas]MBA2918807.1 hypothetical protein [Sphingomonas sp. CGMCC 1.13658]MVO78839.1 hypothetical protein [Sphingomonas horti]